MIPGFGPACTPELRAVGIDSVERIRELGWREAYMRWVESFPSRINVNAASAMVAAERGCQWLEISDEDKEQARALVRRMRGQRNSRSSTAVRSAP